MAAGDLTLYQIPLDEDAATAVAAIKTAGDTPITMAVAGQTMYIIASEDS